MIRRYGRKFFERLDEIVEGTDKSLAQGWARTWQDSLGENRPKGRDGDLAELPAGAWKKWVDALEAKSDAGARQDMFLDKVKSLTGDSAFEEKLATWIWAQNHIARALDSAQAARPNRDRQLTPISKSLNLKGDPRAFQLCGLWRDFLTADNAFERQDAKLRLKSFEENERRLTDEWENARQMEIKAALKQALLFSDTSCLLLSSLPTGVATKSDPVLEHLYVRVAEDSELQKAKLSSLVETIRAELAL